MSAPEQKISPAQLRIGLHIRLDGWMEHPFLFNSFKIRNEKQLRALQSLGIEGLWWLPDKSDAIPLPPPAADAPAPEPAAAVDPDVEAMWHAKQERRESLARQREAYGRCEKKFNASVGRAKSLLRNLFARPQESLQQAQEVVAEMVDTLLAEKDVLLHLMSDKSGDEGAYYHTLNVTMLALILARAAGLAPAEMRALGLGCLLHDMGKERVPSQILLKKTPLTGAERTFYQQHVVYGLEMAAKLPDFPPGALEVIAQHHEMLDGSGYPGRLAAARIGRLGRIAAITNTYDDYCNRLNQAEAMTPAEALAHMFKRERGKFDVELLQHFIRCLGVYPPGSIVQLSNDAIGMVVTVNPGKLLHPILLLYDPTVPKEEALMLDLNEEPELTVVRTLHPSTLTREVHEYLSPRSRISYYAEGRSTKISDT
jgi:putative nucleotidyltransferase with HDIG domain